jgi:hypothetical protein
MVGRAWGRWRQRTRPAWCGVRSPPPKPKGGLHKSLQRHPALPSAPPPLQKGQSYDMVHYRWCVSSCMGDAGGVWVGGRGGCGPCGVTWLPFAQPDARGAPTGLGEGRLSRKEVTARVVDRIAMPAAVTAERGTDSRDMAAGGRDARGNKRANWAGRRIAALELVEVTLSRPPPPSPPPPASLPPAPSVSG